MGLSGLNKYRFCRRTKGVSASEMTYIVSSGALNSTHSLKVITIPTNWAHFGNK